MTRQSNDEMNTIGYPYIKVGRISLSVAKKCHIKAADIYVNMSHIKHIYGKHSKELNSLAISPIDLVKMVCWSFNEIRVGSHGSLLLILNDNKLPKVAAIELSYAPKFEFWEVKTAQPRTVEAVIKKTLIWGVAHHTRYDRIPPLGRE